MFGHSWIVIVILLIIVLIIFGPGKLGDIGGALGKSLKEFRKSSSSPEEPGVTPTARPENGTSVKSDGGPDLRR